MRNKILFKLTQDDEGYPPINYESLWAIGKSEFYQIDNIPFYVYDISLGDIVSVEKRNNEFWFKEVIEPSTNSTMRLYCSEERLWDTIKIKIEELDCKWETTLNSLKAISVPKINLQLTQLYLDKIKRNNSDFDYEDASLR